MTHRILSFALLLSALCMAVRAADEFPILFQEDFEKDASHWQPLDAKQWQLKKTEKGNVFSQHNKETTYKPPHRSPTNVALLKDVIAGDFDLTVEGGSKWRRRAAESGGARLGNELHCWSGLKTVSCFYVGV